MTIITSVRKRWSARKSQLALVAGVVVVAVRRCTYSPAFATLPGAERTEPDTAREVLSRRMSVAGLLLPLTVGMPAAEAADDTGVWVKEGSDRKYLYRCPKDRSCISSVSAEDKNIYVPPWTFTPELLVDIDSQLPGRPVVAPVASGSVKTQEQALKDLKTAVESMGGTVVGTALDGRYLKTSFVGKDNSVDDVVFLFDEPGGEPAGQVDYRSASRADSKEDVDTHRARIRDLRKALTVKYGWKSLSGYK